MSRFKMDFWDGFFIDLKFFFKVNDGSIIILLTI